MNCLDVRDRLPEHAMSVLDGSEAAIVERHLEWCAGCRKESAELLDASATLGLALTPASPPEPLQERVVQTVALAAGNRPGGRRRVRAAAAFAVAAMVAVAALGWGAVMAGQADRERDKAARLEAEQERIGAALEQFRKVLVGQGLPGVPSDDMEIVELGPAPGRAGGGTALILASPSLPDFAVVVVKGLAPSGAPYRVALESGSGLSLPVGRIARDDLDVDGGEDVYREFNRDLSSFTNVVVRNAAGALVLRSTG